MLSVSIGGRIAIMSCTPVESSRRRVLVLNHFAAPRGQAGGTRHVELFSRLTDWDYLIVASDLNPQTGQRIPSESGFATVHVPNYSTNGPRRVANWLAYACGALWLGARQRGIDVVYGSSPHLLAALAAWMLATLKRVPFVMEVRDLWPQTLVDMGQVTDSAFVIRVLRVLESFLYRKAHAIVVMAEGSRSALIEMGVAASKIYFIPNGADLQDFVPSASREQLRDRYQFSRFTAIYAGAHGPANGLEALLKAARDADEAGVDIVLVGGGIEKRKLIARAAREGISNLRFMDPVPKSEISDLLAAADVGLHVLADVPIFQSAISPNKVFDYMAAGLPVLTNVTGVVGDLVIGANAGVAVQPDQVGAGLTQLAGEPEPTLARLGESGKWWISTNQSRTAMASRLQLVLCEVAASQ